MIAMLEEAEDVLRRAGCDVTADKVRGVLQAQRAEPVNQLLLALVKSFGHKVGCAKNAFGEQCTCGVDEAIAAAEQTQQGNQQLWSVNTPFRIEVPEGGFKLAPPKHNIVMKNAERKTVGELDFTGPQLTFTGDADEAAKIFIDFVAKSFSVRLGQEREKACAELMERLARGGDDSEQAQQADESPLLRQARQLVQDIEAKQQAEPVARDVIAKLIALTRAVNIALDDSEERDGIDGREHVIDSVNFDAVCDALEALEELPDNKPGWAMNAADKAEWALRHLTDAQPPAVAEGCPKNLKKLAEWLGHENAVLRNQAVAVPDDWRDAAHAAVIGLGAVRTSIERGETDKALARVNEVRAMLAAAPQAADPIKRLIAMHNELLGEYPYCYFELAYTRRTDWMAWLCTKPREDDPERKVLACGQGLTAEDACAEAISAAQKGGARWPAA